MQHNVFDFEHAPQNEEGALTIRPFSSPLLKNMLVNFSTFAFLLNFSFMKYRKHQSFGFSGYIC